MLTTLRIKNLALVSDLTLELQPGCNIITGETGAGKSIILGALNLVLGGRADRTLIRSGEESCSVEAVFDTRSVCAPLASFLEENGLEPSEDHQLVLKRTFTGAGGNRQFINGSPTSLNVLGSIGEWLVDMHGPHDHQSLLQPLRQLGILDAYGKLIPERDAFGELLQQRTSLIGEKASLIIDEKTYAQQLDLLRFQTQEISAARLLPDEEKSLDEEFNRASNASKLLQVSQAAIEMLSENDGSVLSESGQVGRNLADLQRIDPGAAPLVELHNQANQTLRELQMELSHYLDRIDVDPARLSELEERLNLLHTLKRKYGATLAEVIEFGETAAQKLELLESREAELARIDAAISKLDAELAAAGKKLTAARNRVIPQLAKLVSRQLDDLGFKQSKFDITISAAVKPAAWGLDQVEFQFAPNPGEPFRPLRAIASSGEMARVMLALKTVLAAEDEIPVLVFDEVDANIGGETANVVGEKMKHIARKRQVLCITHLPQVAAAADAHYEVSKQVKDGRTISNIERLDEGARVTELARMLGGQTAAARNHAAAMLKKE
jgi:DNA repair protein RecN (Recombination protein N)